MTAKRNGRVFWLTRDRLGECWYSLWTHHQRPALRMGFWIAKGGALETFCPRQWKMNVQLAAHLQPGGGPIKVRITIEAEP